MEFSLHGVESETHAQVKPAKKSINRQQGRGIFPPNFKNPDRLLEITNYRRFRKLKVEKLARVNLFVGKNNSGKTTLLEAIGIVSSSDSQVVFQSSVRRNEWVMSATNGSEGPGRSEVDASHLFYGHNFAYPSAFFEIITSSDEPGHQTARCQHSDFVDSKGADGLESPDSGLTIDYSGAIHYTFEMSSKVGVDLHTVRRMAGSPRRTSPDVGGQVQGIRQAKMVGTGDFHPKLLASLWNEVQLTPAEQDVINALRILDDRIERIGFSIGADPVPFVSANGSRTPLGSMGDGMTRVLALTLALVTSKNGVLLVDEIDTGLHYSVIEDMWRVIIKTAIRLNIQVFATTHSRDCLDALAWALEDEEAWDDEDVQVHRIEADNEKTVSYSREEIITAARSHIEVR